MPNQAVSDSSELGAIETQLGNMIQSGRSFSGRERNCAYLNISRGAQASGTTFAPVATVTGFDFPDDGRAIALVDWDQDGDLDIWVSNRTAPRIRFLRNNLSGQNHFLLLKLEGNGTTTNRDAIGARVEVTTGSTTPSPLPEKNDLSHSAATTLIKTVRAGEGFLAQSSSWLHFGLGNSKLIEKVVVKWPDGTAQSLVGLQPNGRYILKQGNDHAVELPATERNLALKPVRIEVPSTSSKVRISVLSQLRMPALHYLDNHQISARLKFGQNQPVLVTLWTKTCRPCLVELKEFGQHADELRQAGLEIMAFSIDGAATDSYAAAEATDMLGRLGYSFQSGGATNQLVNTLQAANNFIVTNDRPLPLPTSFLIDASGYITHIYKGPVAIVQLLEDLREKPASLADRFRRAALSEGAMLDHPYQKNVLKSTEINRRFQWANTMEPFSSPLETATHYQQVVKLKPDFVEAQSNYGVYLMRAGQLDKAVKVFRQAIEIDNEYWLAHMNLAGAKLRQKKSAQAELVLENWLNMKPNHAPALCELGVVYFQNGRKAAAEKLFRSAVHISPELGRPYYCLGIFQASQGNMTEAESLFRKAVTLSPKDTEAHQALTKIRRQRTKNQATSQP